PTVVDKTQFCGYIVQRASREAAAAIRQELRLNGEPLSVVSTGGGGDGFALLRAYADAAGPLRREGVESVVCLRPGMPPQQRSAWRHRRLRLSAGVPLFASRPDLVNFLRQAAVTVSMAGYNTVAEVRVHGKPAVVVPRVFPRREQWLRAHALEERGLLRTV